MDKTITVKVTQKNIDNGVQESLYNCPVACALKDGGYRDVVVEGSTAIINGTTYPLPGIVRMFIKGFDKSRASVAPVSFALTLNA